MHTRSIRFLLPALVLLVPAGCASVTGSRGGVPPNVRTITAIGDRPLPVASGETGRAVAASDPEPEPPPAPMRRVAGRVVDADGAPVPGATVRVAVNGSSSGRSLETETDDLGRFAMSNLREGSTYSLIAEWEDERGDLHAGRRVVTAPAKQVQIVVADPADPGPGRVERVSNRRRAPRRADDSLTLPPADDEGGLINVEDIPDPDSSSEPEPAPIADGGSRRRRASPRGGWRGHETPEPRREADRGAPAPLDDPPIEEDDGPNPLPPAIESRRRSPPPDFDVSREEPEPARATGPAPPPFPPDPADARPAPRAGAGGAAPSREVPPMPDAQPAPAPSSAAGSPAPPEFPPLQPERPATTLAPAPAAAGFEPRAAAPPAMEPSPVETAPEPPPTEPAAIEPSAPDRLPPAGAAPDAADVPLPDAPAPDALGAAPRPAAGATWGEVAGRGFPAPERRRATRVEEVRRVSRNVALQPGPPASPAGPVRASCRYDARHRRLADFSLPDLDGRAVRFRDLDCELVLLDFWGTWCGPCVKSIPHLAELQRRYGDGRLKVIGIAYEQGDPRGRPAALEAAVRKLGINYAVLVGEADGSPCPLQAALHVQAYPTMVLLDRQGNVLWRDQGSTPQTLARLDRVVAAKARETQIARAPDSVTSTR